MVRKKIVVSLLLILVFATGVEAQGIGSAIKKKVVSAAQGSGAAPASPASPAASQSGSKLGFALTDAAMTSLESGMRTEIAMRQAYTASLAGLKTLDEFYLCEGQVQAGPEGMAVQEEMANRYDKATTQADFEKITTWFADTIAVLVTKACGANPKSRYDAQEDEFTKAREAGAAEFGSALPGSLATDVARWYGIVQEWAVPFYGLSASAQQNAAANGLSIPGSGTNIFWVYTAGEATLLLAHKATLEPLLKALL